MRKNPDFAAEYLRAAMEDKAEPRVLLVALRRVAEARGLGKVAKTAGIERESPTGASGASGCNCPALRHHGDHDGSRSHG